MDRGSGRGQVCQGAGLGWPWPWQSTIRLAQRLRSTDEMTRRRYCVVVVVIEVVACRTGKQKVDVVEGEGEGWSRVYHNDRRYWYWQG